MSETSNQTSDDMQEVVKDLTASIKRLNEIKTHIKTVTAGCKSPRLEAKTLSERILALMSQHGIDKANFEELGCCVSIATSKRKKNINSRNMYDMLSKHIPEADAAEICQKITAQVEKEAEEYKFIRFGKK